MKANKLYTTVACLLLAATMKAQDTKSQFNPIEHAVVSQTIAPDARAAVPLLTRMSTHNIGILQSIRSASVVQALP